LEAMHRIGRAEFSGLHDEREQPSRQAKKK
jgi:hypothetical protein